MASSEFGERTTAFLDGPGWNGQVGEVFRDGSPTGILHTVRWERAKKEDRQGRRPYALVVDVFTDGAVEFDRLAAEKPADAALLAWLRERMVARALADPVA